jgi:hypothetical protein
VLVLLAYGGGLRSWRAMALGGLAAKEPTGAEDPELNPVAWLSERPPAAQSGGAGGVAASGRSGQRRASGSPGSVGDAGSGARP